VVALHNLGLCYRRTGEFGSAIEAWERVLKYEPKRASSMYALARMYAAAPASFNGEKALHYSEELLKLDPNSSSFKDVNAMALAAAGRFGEAISATEKLIEGLPDGHPMRQELSSRLKAYKFNTRWIDR